MINQLDRNLLLSSESYITQKEYWKSKLVPDDDTELLHALLFSEHEPEFVEQTINIPQSTLINLKNLGRNTNLSIYIILLSAIKIVIKKYNGRDLNAVISPVNLNLSVPALNRYVLIQDAIKNDESFREILIKSGKSVVDAYNNQDYPAEEYLTDLQDDRSFGNGRISKVICHFIDIHGKEFIQRPNDIGFYFERHSESIQAFLRYDKLLFEDYYITQLNGHFLTVLNNVLTDVTQKVSEISLYSEAEINDILNNARNVPLPEGTFVDLFNQQVQRNPSSPAAVLDETVVSYQQLNEHSNKLANVLLGIKRINEDDIIAIIIDRSPVMMQTILSIWKCGAAYLPIDPVLPAVRINTILTHAAPTIILIQEKYLSEDLTAKFGDRLLLIEEVLKKERAESPAPPPVKINPSSLAYVLYTSGSTGAPKGVMIEHKGMLNHLLAKVADLELSYSSVCIQNAAAGFDISVWQFFSVLLVGGKTVIIRDEVIHDITRFLYAVQKAEATILEVVPSYLSVMLDQMDHESLKLDLKYLLVTGEAFKAGLVNRWFTLFPTIKVINAYGPTEASDDITHYIMDRPANDGYLPIGKPVQNMNVFILNEDFGLCPKGVRGEICVSGLGVGRGYLADNLQTEAVFIKSTDKRGPGCAFYRTGDYGMILQDGNIIYQGRRDQQVKINGHRIELAEIEKTISEKDFVNGFVVLELVNSSGGKYLCGYYIVKSGATLTMEYLRALLMARLPFYMVPAFLIEMASFPTTVNGKINKKALPVPRLINTAPGTPGSFISHIQERLTKIWELILGVSNISVTDNFFDLGGHSLSVARLIVYAHKEFDIEIRYEDVFRFPTIEELTEVLTNAEINKFETITPAPRQELYDVSQSQKRLWIISQMEEEKYIYNIPQSYELKGKLNKTHFFEALERLVKRHEILRTTFLNIDGEPKQKVNSYDDCRFVPRYVDLSENSAANHTIRQLIQEEEKFPFDLEQGPLIRATLIRVAADNHVFLFTLHHIIADGWSFEVMKNDVFFSYTSLIENGLDLPDLSIQYKDYAWWQKKQIQSSYFQKHRIHWLNKFQDEIPILDLPADYARPAEKTYNGKSIDIGLGESITRQIKQFSENNGVSLFMFLLAAVKTLMYRYSSQTDLIIGTPIAGRLHQDLDNQVGFYVNLLPIRTIFSGDDTFASFLQNVKQNALSAYEHGLYPFDHLVNELAIDRDLSRSPLFDVLVVLQNTDFQGNGVQSMPGITIENYPLVRTVVKYDLSFNFSQDDNEVGLSLEYNSDLYSDQRMQNLVTHLIKVIENAIADSNQKMHHISYMLSSEKDLLIGFNRTEKVLPADHNIIHLLESQAARTPDLIALKFNSHIYTYRQLNDLINQVADSLILEKNIKPGDKIGVLLDRDVFSVIAMVAVLKIGACYVPLEVNLPDNRIEFIIGDLSPHLIIVDEKNQNRPFLASQPLIVVEDIDCGLYSPVNPVIDIGPEAFSYIIYTSGSTGKPKGVIQTHLTLYNLISWQISTWNLSPGSRFLQHASFGFDASLHDILFALSVGGEIFLLDEDRRADLKAIKELVITERIEILWFTFSSLVALFDDLEPYFADLSLKHIVTTGEAANLNNSIGRYLQFEADVILHNFYGPSETHVVTSFSVGKDTIIEHPENLSIGSPIINTKIYILDDQLNLQPPGIPGEIYVESDNLFKGYLNQEELTKRSCIDNPNNPGTLIYKTGDFGRWLYNGNLEFLGRKDQQVKIRGFRIELKEIESFILNFEGVDSTLVVCRDLAVSNKALIAYLTVSFPVDLALLYNYLHKCLPEYMVPVHFVILDSFPLTLNGKIDVKSLPDPDKTIFDQQHVSPANETEHKLLSIWTELLGKQEISTLDNFFKIGGHSLTATRMASKIFKEFDVDINLRKIYKHSNIQELSLEIMASKWVNTPVTEDQQNTQRIIL
ncbi:amino acid adenylation domain-containing protein [Mucilaginibacter sp. RCC_168]|uniref:amino acid adenylation domain-containing protein n=1 Tax=Mucilaginibacter sp. RCC_168 TaxID=3239221 RepID=UPI0035254D12